MTTMSETAEAPPDLRARGLSAATAGIAAVLVTVALIGGLDLVKLVTDPAFLRLTISEYGLTGQRWMFDSAVLILAAGSLAVLVSLARQGLARWFSGGALAMTLWSAGLAAVVIFPKQDWSQPENLSGQLHRIGSLVAFLSLPVAAWLLARPWLKDDTWGAMARRTRLLGWASAAAFLPIVFVVAYAGMTGANWWEILPLGYIERLLVIVEVITVLVLGAWALAGAKDLRPLSAPAAEPALSAS